MTESSDDRIREFLGETTSQATEPLAWAEVELRAVTTVDAEPRRYRWEMWLGAAATVAVVVGGFLVLDAGNRPDDTAAPTVSTRPSSTTEPAAPATPTTESIDTVAPPASFLGDPGGPVSGQVQRTVIGDITWTLLEGDDSNLPMGVSASIDGQFYAREGEVTWRSSNGVDWEQVDLAPDGIVGIFEIDGESWARRSTLEGQGLGRWNGEVFEPVALPPSTAPGVEGLRTTPIAASAPVEFRGQWVIPVATRIGIPWDELYPGAIAPEWDAVTRTVRIVDMDSGEPEAVLDAALTEGARVELRDATTGELVVAAATPAGVAPDDFFRALTEQAGITHHELLLGDAEGFDAVEAPRPFADAIEVAAVGDVLLAAVSTRMEDAQLVELWASTDGRSWQEVETPEPSGERLDWIEIESDGSLALLTIVSGTENSQESERWSTVDGVAWTPFEAVAGFDSPRYTDIGWLVGDIYGADGVQVSADGLDWQRLDFDIRPPAGPGGGGVSVYGDTIFVTTHEGDERRMWVGRVTGPDE